MITCAITTKRMDNGTQPRTSGKRVQIWVFLAVCLVGCCLFLSRIHRGFSPWDDPIVAHTAERTLNGETPQIDFHDNYTEGLSYLNAVAMRAFGVRLLSIRIVLFIFFVPWMAVTWYLVLGYEMHNNYWDGYCHPPLRHLECAYLPFSSWLLV